MHRELSIDLLTTPRTHIKQRWCIREDPESPDAGFGAATHGYELRIAWETHFTAKVLIRPLKAHIKQRWCIWATNPRPRHWGVIPSYYELRDANPARDCIPDAI